MAVVLRRYRQGVLAFLKYVDTDLLILQSASDRFAVEGMAMAYIVRRRWLGSMCVQLHTMILPAGVIIPAPTGGTLGRTMHSASGFRRFS